MGLCSRRNKESHDPDEVTVTCFGGKKKGKKSTGVCSGILVETEGLIKDLRQEVSELRHAQTGKHDEAKRLEDSVVRLMDDKERMMEERGRLREELTCLRVENNSLDQRTGRLTQENQELSKELKTSSRDLNTSVETAREEQSQTTKMAESLKLECRDVKTSLVKTREELEHITRKLKETEDKYESGQAEVEGLTKELSNVELCKIVSEKTVQAKMSAARKKYIDLKRICRGKDVLIHHLKEEKSRALMQLWQTTYGRSSHLPGILSGEAPRSKQLPLATVGPFQNEIITVCTATSPVKGQEIDQMSSDFLKNKTMSMEFELYRQRKMAEIFGTDSSSVSDDEKSTFSGSDVKDDISEGVSDYVDSFLECVVEKHETGSSLASVSSEMIL